MSKSIFYIFNRDPFFGKARADAIIAVQTCYQLAAQGHRVTLITPRYARAERHSKQDLWRHYNIPEDSFKWLRLPTCLSGKSSAFALFFERLSKFAWHSLSTLKLGISIVTRPAGETVIICRDIIGSYPYCLFLAPIRKAKQLCFVGEVHDPGTGKRHRWVYERMDAFYVTTDATKRKLSTMLDLDAERIATIRNGFDPSAYENSSDKETLRKELGLPVSAILATYTGKISMEMKEVHMLVDTAAMTPSATFIMVGGRPEVVEHWQHICRERGILNMSFTGFVDPADVSKYQLSSDILLMYYPGDWPIAASISPGKMGEYMATGNAIVSVDFDTIKEVLHDGDNALLVMPDAPSELSSAIIALVDQPERRKKLGDQARKDAELLSWENRAKKITELIGDLSAKPEFQ